MIKTHCTMLVTVLAIVLGSCAPQSTPANFPSALPPVLTPTATTSPQLPTRAAETQTSPPRPTQGVETHMPPALPAFTPALQSMAEKARLDLAGRLSVTVTDITVVQAAPVTWPDSSLGCPQPGMVYAQMLVPGFLVVLKHAAGQFEYHAGKDRVLFYCKDPQPPSSLGPDNM